MIIIELVLSMLSTDPGPGWFRVNPRGSFYSREMGNVCIENSSTSVGWVNPYIDGKIRVTPNLTVRIAPSRCGDFL